MKNEWRTSSRSTGCGACVQVRKADDGVQLRDSKNPALGIIKVTNATWNAMLADLK